MFESIFNSELCKIFKSTYFEEHLLAFVCENVFMKLRKIKNFSEVILTLHKKNRIFEHQDQKQVKMLFLFYDYFPLEIVFAYNVS